MISRCSRPRAILFTVLSLCACSICFGAKEVPTVAFKQEPGKLLITIGGTAFATYVHEDSKITRPYFAHVRSPAGIQVTRNHPPIEGQDATDHATMHPGVWLAFGDINGNDYWRLRAKVKHEAFAEGPEGGAGRGTFTVRNRYLSAEGDRTVCVERCHYMILVRRAGYLLICDSTFTSESGDFAFGDQEEFGLGMRVATPISVRQGGHITDSEGRKNEKQVWGKQADWCDYSGTIKGHRVGMTVMPDPNNFRRSWYHARDYGLVVANPFGRNAMTRGEKSKVAVREGEAFHLGYGVFIYAAPAGAKVDIDAAYRDYLKIISARTGQ